MPLVTTAEVAGEDEPPRAAVLAVVQLDDRRTQDVARVVVGELNVVEDLLRLTVVQTAEILDHPFDVGQFEQRFDGFGLRIAQVAVTRILALYAGAVTQHDADDGSRGARYVDWPLEAGAHETG